MKLGKQLVFELIWLLGSWVSSFVITGWLVGGHYRLLTQPVDIQLHNTYFVVGFGLATFPLFLVLATLVTGMRAGTARFRYRATNLILVLLGLLWLLVALASWVQLERP